MMWPCPTSNLDKGLRVYRRPSTVAEDTTTSPHDHRLNQDGASIKFPASQQ